MRRRISIRGGVRLSGRRSVRLSRVIFRRVLGASCAVYPALFLYEMNVRLHIVSTHCLWGLQAELVGDALRESVSKVAGRLSTLSTGIVSSIQDKYSS